MLASKITGMKFVVQCVRSGYRLGQITELGQKADTVIDTPACLAYTRGGSFPNLTSDMIEKIGGKLPAIAHVPLVLLVGSHESLAKYEKGIKQFSGLQNMLIYSTLQDPAVTVPSGYNGKAGISVWTRGGKVKVNTDLFMKVQEACQPDIYQALCDSDTDSNASKKRIKHSVERSLEMLDQCLDKHSKSERLKHSCVFGSIQGGYSLDDRLKSAKETATRPVSGFCLEGFHNMGPDTETFDLDAVATIIKNVMNELPEDKPRIMHQVWTPAAVLQGLAMGLDLFDSSYPYIVTERGRALVFNYNYNSSGTENLTIKEPKLEINLKEERYFEDFTPICEKCTCYTCQTHSRSYMCHLLNTGEILAGVLLAIHNYHHYFGYFEKIREAIKQDSVDKLSNLIASQSR